MNKNAEKITMLSKFHNLESPFLFDDYALCFGHFNVIHPGHLRYFQTAHSYKGKIVVALEGDRRLTELARGEWFTENERAQAVAALEIIDKVVILDSGDLAELVSTLKPALLILGREFEGERAPEVAVAIAVVRASGGEVIYAPGEARYTSTNLFYGRKDELEVEKWSTFERTLTGRGIDLTKLTSRIGQGRRPNLLIIGDTILDQYVPCDPVGMSNEAPVVVVKELERVEFIGGAAIVAAHTASFGANATFISVTGDDPDSDLVFDKLSQAGVTPILFKDFSRPTTRKTRFMVENQKLFRVSLLKEHSISKDLEQKIIKTIDDVASNVEAIIVSDFVYGVITKTILDKLLTVAKQGNIPLLGDLQCSSQIGNVSKFKDFFLICPTEREARIALSNQDDGIENVANLLMKKTRCKNMIVKLGAEGLIAYCDVGSGDFLQRQHLPALAENPVDVAGAGDTLIAAVAVGLTKGLSLIEASALGCCASAVSVQQVGNMPVSITEITNLIEKRKLSIYAD